MKIAKNKALTEFEVQALALSLLRDALGEEYIVRGEYHYRGCRFDLAIFCAESRDLICTIEVKKRVNRTGRKASTRAQIRKYEAATGRPCVLLHEGNVHGVVAALRGRISRGNAGGTERR